MTEREQALQDAIAVCQRVQRNCRENVKVHRPPYKGANEEIAVAHENGEAIAHQIESELRALQAAERKRG